MTMAFAVVVVVSMILVGSASEQTSLHQDPRVASSGMWVASWGDAGRQFRFITPMVFLDGDLRPDRPNASIDFEEIARRLKNRPDGRRALLMQRYCHSFWSAQADSVRGPRGERYSGPWADDALRQVAAEWPRLLALIKYCGGTIDLLVGDFEESGVFSSWSMTDAGIDAFRADPRWRSGHLGLPPLGELLSDISASGGAQIRDSSGSSKLRWNTEIERYAAAYMRAALWTPAVSAFPRVRGTNYNGFLTDAVVPPCRNGHLQPHNNVFGTSSGPALYGEIEGLATRVIDPTDSTKIRTAVAGVAATQIQRTPWLALLTSQQIARSCIRAGSPLIPWIANPSYDGMPSGKGLGCFPKDLRCYDENIKHLAMLGSEVLLWWRNDSVSLPEEGERIEQLLVDINRATNGRVCSALVSSPIALDSEYLLSGGTSGQGKSVWRLTLSPDCKGVRDRSSGIIYRSTPDTLGFWILRDTVERPDLELVTH